MRRIVEAWQRYCNQPPPSPLGNVLSAVFAAERRGEAMV